MARPNSFKFRAVTALQRYVVNPLTVRNPAQVLLETTGRVSGEPRRTPVGGSLVGSVFWLVSEHGERAQYVRNILADPRVRVRLEGRWHTGTAAVLPDDDPRERLRSLPRGNSAAVAFFGTDLLTVRVDLAAPHEEGAGGPAA
ncbi:nitroreductase/quinone reductase family protein [Streptomyces fuscigenes]|uniref:nitroreductase/quinone reductase family protein n=1 Tax=Streptomyces fuscigenes TaxID=1528880 RepID=UPI001F2B99ED|nr:nitroreductase/quinone reductase family protein [Streptomyces fuscigenes]MCF3964532.1 nitroreductase family deazaflavin-dependent oxidoreductase [Streptomyces fuscigenes]